MRKNKKKNSKLILFSLIALPVVIVVAGILIYLNRNDAGGDPMSKDDWWKIYPAVSEDKCKEWNGTLIEAKKDLHCDAGMIPGAQVEVADGMKVCCMYVDANFNKAFQSPVEEAQLNVKAVLAKQLNQTAVEITVQQQNDDHIVGTYTSADGKTTGKFYAVKPGMEWVISDSGKKSISCSLGEQHGYPKEWIQDCVK